MRRVHDSLAAYADAIRYRGVPGSAALTMVIGRLRVATFAVPFCRVHEGNIRLNIRTTDPYIILLDVLPDKHLLEKNREVGVCRDWQPFQQWLNCPFGNRLVGGRNDRAEIPASALERCAGCSIPARWMADLRCALLESKEHRTWPVLHRLGMGMPIANRVAAIVAAQCAIRTVPANIAAFRAKTAKMARSQPDAPPPLGMRPSLLLTSENPVSLCRGLFFVLRRRPVS